MRSHFLRGVLGGVVLVAVVLLTVILVHATDAAGSAATSTGTTATGMGSCGSQGQGGIMGGGGMMCNSSQASPPPGTPQTGITRLTITSDAFQPASIQVPRGTTVTWVNHDTDNHTVTFVGAMMDGGMLMPGDSYQYTFTQPGTYHYSCMYHVGMVGWVTVTP